MIRDVSSNEALLSALKEAQELRDTASYTQDWAAKLTTFLNAVAKRSPQALIEKDFLQYLWDEQAVSSTGNGSVKIGPALENSDFRNWFAEQIRHAPNESGPLDAYLKNLYGQLVSRMEVLCGRVPRLKINRVLCALFPESFTTIADIGRLQKLHGAMGGPNGAHPVQMHAFIRSRIDEVLGPAPADGKVARLSLPWYLYDALSAGVEPSPQATSTPIDSTLTPLIAIKRRKGLTAMKGSFASLMNYVQILEDGLTREEFADAIRRENPDLAADSIPSVINSVAREFGLCAIENGVYR
ncbi:MAG TPA: hypothetical protein VFT37_06615, partial [Telluria sp.]|nr:hypothetical protein [Telluria sp.]